jgi:hypothetical protein
MLRPMRRAHLLLWLALSAMLPLLIFVAVKARS